MLFTDEDLVRILRDRNIYSYLEVLSSLHSTHESNEALVNTVELFAFGNYSEFLRHSQDFIPLAEEELLLKLIELTILSISNDLENCSVKIDYLFNNKNYELQKSLRAYADISTLDNSDLYLVFDRIIVSMIEKNLLDVKVDDETESLYVGKPHIFRDVYDCRQLKLRVLDEQEIAPRSIGCATQNLKRWLDNGIVPAIKSFSNNKDMFASRKRKQSENSI